MLIGQIWQPGKPLTRHITWYYPCLVMTGKCGGKCGERGNGEVMWEYTEKCVEMKYWLAFVEVFHLKRHGY